ncbi:unnamed protein product, partial [Gongylonema pulchrum]|uniref:PUL domain-containing protein n=1 Tax=Gongylonema pulchrum TaxID=637853 RepID=A0A183CYR9_9BILA
MDAFRLALLEPTLNRIFCTTTAVVGRAPKGLETMQRLTNFLVCLRICLRTLITFRTIISANSDPIRIVACRAMANAAFHQWGRNLFTHDVATTVTAVAAQLLSPKPALQLAAATVLANWALVLLQQTETEKIAELGPREDVLRVVLKMIDDIGSFGDHTQDALIRLLQAIVTLMWGDASLIK